MWALSTARYGLLISALVWAITLMLGIVHIGDAGLEFGLGLYAGIGIGLFALLCVVLQFVILPPLLRKN